MTEILNNLFINSTSNQLSLGSTNKAVISTNPSSSLTYTFFDSGVDSNVLMSSSTNTSISNTPSTGKILVATSSTAASWQTDSFFPNWIFGAPLDADLTVTSTTATMSGDRYYTNVTLSTGNINTNGWRLFVRNLSVTGNCAISNNGFAGSGTGAGGAGGIGNSILSGGAGGAGNVAAGSAGGIGANGVGGGGGNGGTGGTGTGGVGGAGGTVLVPSASNGDLRCLNSIFNAITFTVVNGGSTLNTAYAQLTGGGGGGGGGGSASYGGSGGGGGGGLLLAAENISGTGNLTVSATGGNGGAAAGTNSGGGAGGGGGLIVLVYHTSTVASLTTNVSGGTGTAGTGTGTAGTNGSVGNLFAIQI